MKRSWATVFVAFQCTRIAPSLSTVTRFSRSGKSSVITHQSVLRFAMGTNSGFGAHGTAPFNIAGLTLPTGCKLPSG